MGKNSTIYRLTEVFNCVFSFRYFRGRHVFWLSPGRGRQESECGGTLHLWGSPRLFKVPQTVVLTLAWVPVY